MPIYYSTCLECGHEQDQIADKYLDHDETFMADECPKCGRSLWKRHGVNLTANMHTSWEMAAHTRKGISPPNPYKPR